MFGFTDVGTMPSSSEIFLLKSGTASLPGLSRKETGWERGKLHPKGRSKKECLSHRLSDMGLKTAKPLYREFVVFIIIPFLLRRISSLQKSVKPCHYNMTTDKKPDD
jgi:hypothetical protein